MDLGLIDARATDIASDARHLPEVVWVAPCGRFAAYPTEAAIVVLEILGGGFAEVRRVPLPAATALRHRAPGRQRAEGIQCGALGPGGAVIAIATHAQVLIASGDGWRGLSLSATLDELEAGDVDDEDARWLGEPDAIGFDRGGGLWLAATHVEGRERLTRIDARTAGIVATAELGDEGGFPDPVHVTLVPGARGVGVTIACGQDGAAAIDAGLVDEEIVVVPAVPFGDPPVHHLGWAADGARVVATWERVWRIAAEGTARLAEAAGARDLTGVLAGGTIALSTDAGGLVLIDAMSLAPCGQARVHGTILYAVHDGILSVGWGLDWGHLWLYRFASADAAG